MHHFAEGGGAVSVSKYRAGGSGRLETRYKTKQNDAEARLPSLSARGDSRCAWKETT